MFGYEPEVILKGVVIFGCVFIFLFGLAFLISGGFSGKESIIPVIGALILAFMTSAGSMYSETIENNRQADLSKEVAKLLDVDEGKVELSTVIKPEYDYTLKVGKDLVGVVYDEDMEEIKYLISNDRYIYERGTK